MTKTKVIVSTDGRITQAVAEDLIDAAQDRGAEITAYQNGIKAVFEDAEQADQYREWVLSDQAFKGKLANLYIGEDN